jgi:hypothetical protein
MVLLFDMVNDALCVLRCYPDLTRTRDHAGAEPLPSLYRHPKSLLRFEDENGVPSQQFDLLSRLQIRGGP